MDGLKPWEMKRPACERAVDEYARSGMTVGLGTGNSANFAVMRLAEMAREGAGFVCVASSVKTAELAKIHARLRAMLQHDSVAHKPMHLIRRSVYTVTWYDGDTVKSVACKPLITKLSRHGAPMIVHTRRLIKPWGVYAVRNVPWGATEHRKVIVVKVVEAQKEEMLKKEKQKEEKQKEKKQKAEGPEPGATILTRGNYWQGHSHDIPRLFAPDGAPVFTLHGRFIGIVYGRSII